MNPLVSIIVNNYNYGRFVGEAIDSALGQTYRNTEVMVVDDGSTDNSREVIAGYGSRIIPVLKENGGQGSAFNAGFAASRGEFVLFLDADDALEPNAIESALGEWKEGATRVFFPLRAVDASGRLLGRIIGGRSGPSALMGPYCGGAEYTSGNIFRRESLARVMPVPEEDWRICADTYLCAANSLFGEAVRVEQPLGRYRIHGSNNFEGAQNSLARARHTIHYNLKLYAALSPLAGGKLGPLEHWLGTSPDHWALRIYSLRQSPEDHPLPDTLLSLTARAVKATWRDPTRSFRQKLGYAVYVTAYGTLPRSAAPAVSRLLRKIDGRKPGRTFQRLMGA